MLSRTFPVRCGSGSSGCKFFSAKLTNPLYLNICAHFVRKCIIVFKSVKLIPLLIDRGTNIPLYSKQGTAKVQINTKPTTNGTEKILTDIMKKAHIYWALRYLYSFGYMFVLCWLLSDAKPGENGPQYLIIGDLACDFAEVVQSDTDIGGEEVGKDS